MSNATSLDVKKTQKFICIPCGGLFLLNADEAFMIGAFSWKPEQV